MDITVISLFPEVFGGFISSSIIGRAVADGLVGISCIPLREYSRDKHRKCDDYPFGGGPGMVMKPEPVIGALEAIGVEGKRIVYPSAGGRRYRQADAERLSRESGIVIICGHYEGLDQRVIDRYVTDEYAVGDYVLSGGESAAMIIIDSVVRLLEGAISAESLSSESFSDGLLEYPQYTRPRSVAGMNVPDVLLNGNHEEIRRWRLKKSVEKTRRYRPDLMADGTFPDEVNEIMRESEVNEYGSYKGD